MIAAPLILNAGAAKIPLAECRPQTVGLHGDKISDPYFWLREKGAQVVTRYLESENAYAAAVVAPFQPFEEALYAEMLGRIKQTDTSAPYSQRGYWLYQRTEQGRQYPIMCRRKGAPDGPEEIVLDINRLADGHPFMALGLFEYSDNNALLAYSTDLDGHRDYALHIIDLETGAELATPIGNVSSAAWAADDRTIFYVAEDDAKRSYRLYRYILGEEKPTLLYEEGDELFEVGISRSLDGKYLFASAASSRTTEYRFLPADQPRGKWQLLAPRRDEIEYYPEHRNGIFYIRTNDGAKEFRVVTASVDASGVDLWKEFVPARPGVKIEDFQAYAAHAVITGRANALPQFEVLNFTDERIEQIHFRETVYDVAAAHNAEYDTPIFRYHYQSPVTPPSVYAYEFATGNHVLLKRIEISGGYDPDNYLVERLLVPATDGTPVPLDIVRRKDVRLDGEASCWLHGYGAYGISEDASFSACNVSLLDRGVIYAVAHVRGGGELGEAWHEGGRMMTKRNTFTDFIACADYLAHHGYTAHDRLVIEGGSAGGLLVGATLNLRPDLCRAAILTVPFVDVLNTMSDASLPLTTGEYIEWGNPNDRSQYEYIKSYSPYDNIAARDYPAMLLMTSLHDSQVPYWEAAKYTARMRASKTDNNPLLLRINLEAGHGGSSGRYDRLRETAFENTFGLAVLGLIKP